MKLGRARGRPAARAAILSRMFTDEDTASGSDRAVDVRIAGRVVVLDQRTGRVLLQLHRWPHEVHWACPGGGAELSETPRQAAARELLEETGRSDPVGVELFTWEHDLRFEGASVRQRETYFLARTEDTDLPVNTPDLADGIERRAWLSTEDIEALGDPVWPSDLVSRLQALGPAGV